MLDLSDINLNVEPSKAESETVYRVMPVFTFTDKDLEDETPITLTKRQLFEIMKESDESVVEEGAVEENVNPY